MNFTSPTSNTEVIEYMGGVELEVLSWVASIGSLVKLFPQIYLIWKNPSHAAGLSWGMLLCAIMSGTASVIIGVVKDLPYFSLGYSAVMIGYFILVGFKYRITFCSKKLVLVSPTEVTISIV
jgi:hypothetical protein